MYANCAFLFNRCCPPVFAPISYAYTHTRVPNFSRIIFPVGVQKITSGTNPFSIGVTCDAHTHTRARSRTHKKYIFCLIIHRMRVIKGWFNKKKWKNTIFTTMYIRISRVKHYVLFFLRSFTENLKMMMKRHDNGIWIVRNVS